MGEQKILFIAYNMKLQFILIASTLAVTFSKNIPVPQLNRNTKKNLKNLSNNAEAFLAANGVTVDLDGRVQQAGTAIKPQLNQIKQQANKVANTYGVGIWDKSLIP